MHILLHNLKRDIEEEDDGDSKYFLNVTYFKIYFFYILITFVFFFNILFRKNKNALICGK